MGRAGMGIDIINKSIQNDHVLSFVGSQMANGKWQMALASLAFLFPRRCSFSLEIAY